MFFTDVRNIEGHILCQNPVIHGLHIVYTIDFSPDVLDTTLALVIFQYKK